MILRCYNCEGAEIDLSEHVAVLEVEPPYIFRNILFDFLTAEFPVREVMMEQEGKQLKAADVTVVSDFIGFTPSSRAVLTKLYKHLDDRMRQDPLVRRNLDNLIAALKSGTEEALRDYCVDFSMSETIEFKDVFAMLGLAPECSSDSVGERLVQFVSVCAELRLYKAIVLVQPKAYMTDEEIVGVYERALSSRIGLVVMDNMVREKALRHEKKICIGRDYSDIMI